MLSKHDLHVLSHIQERATKELGPLGLGVDDLRAGYIALANWHERQPVNLELLLAAPLGTFSHDYCGILHNRELFSPRCGAEWNPRTPHEAPPDEQDEDAHITEWVGHTYQINFNECSVAARIAFRERYKEKVQ